MNQQSAQEIEKLLLELPSRLAPRRDQAAKKLGALDLKAADYPDVPPERFTEFRRAVIEAVALVRDGTAIKQAMSGSALVPGYVPLVLYIVTRFFGISLGAIFGIAAMVWLMFWYFRLLNKAVESIAIPARRALEIGRETGLFKGSVPTK